MLAYTDTGSGPALAFAHGMGSDRRRWEPLVQRLSDDFRCITLDMPGHGDSPAEGMDVLSAATGVQEVLDHLAAGPTTVVGHSFGANVALVHGALHRPRSVVAVDPGHLHLRSFSATLAPYADRMRGDDFEAAFLEWEHRTWQPERVPGGLVFRPRQEVVLAYWSALFSPEEADRRQQPFNAALRAVEVPTLVCLGDEPTPEDAAILSTMSTTTVEVWPGQGHFLHLRDPDRFAHRLRRWHDEVAGS